MSHKNTKNRGKFKKMRISEKRCLETLKIFLVPLVCDSILMMLLFDTSNPRAGELILQ